MKPKYNYLNTGQLNENVQIINENQRETMKKVKSEMNM